MTTKTVEPDYITAYNLRTDPALYYRRAVDEFLGYERGTAYAIHSTTVDNRCMPAMRNVHAGYITRIVNRLQESGRYREIHVSLDLCG